MTRQNGTIVSAMRRNLVLMAAAALHVALVTSAHAARVDRVDLAVDNALRSLYAHAAAARALREKVKAVLVFPRIVKTGSASDGRGGYGVLREHGMSTGYYRSLGVSSGTAAGIESFGCALFFMSNSALDFFRKSDGWEIGTGPTVVLVDQRVAGQLSTASPQDAIYAFVFDQKGLMTGVELRGSKITQFRPKSNRRLP